jgi:hypothetical protein
MMPLRNEFFRVVWPERERPDGGYGQAFVDGFTIYSLWPAPPAQSLIDELRDDMQRDWPEPDTCETRATVVAPTEYVDVIFDVRVWRWPDDDRWLSILEAWLRRIVDAGAHVAWVAPEGFFSWPDVFAAGSNAYAAYSRQTGFMHGKIRAGIVECVGDDEVLRLREAIVRRN